MSDDQDTAQTLLLTLTEADRILTAMGQAQLLKEYLTLVRATLDSAKRNGRAELLVVIKKDLYDTPALGSESLPDEHLRASVSTDLDRSTLGLSRKGGRT